MHVWLVKPEPSYLHSEGLRHVAQGFADAFGTELNVGPISSSKNSLVFCAHLLTDIHPDMTVYNAEQVRVDLFNKVPQYLNVLKKAKCVWDYSRNNIDEFAKLGVKAKLCEIGYMPGMTKLGLQSHEQPIDVLFYGSVNNDRLKILNMLDGNCKLKVAFNIYGDELDRLISQSKIILNMHYYDTAIHEIFRTSYLMSNKKFVVSENGKDKKLEKKYDKGMWFCNYEKLASECLWALREDRLRREVAEEGFRVFSKVRQSDYLKVVV